MDMASAKSKMKSGELSLGYSTNVKMNNKGLFVGKDTFQSNLLSSTLGQSPQRNSDDRLLQSFSLTKTKTEQQKKKENNKNIPNLTISNLKTSFALASHVDLTKSSSHKESNKSKFSSNLSNPLLDVKMATSSVSSSRLSSSGLATKPSRHLEKSSGNLLLSNSTFVNSTSIKTSSDLAGTKCSSYLSSLSAHSKSSAPAHSLCSKPAAFTETSTTLNSFKATTSMKLTNIENTVTKVSPKKSIPKSEKKNIKKKKKALIPKKISEENEEHIDDFELPDYDLPQVEERKEMVLFVPPEQDASLVQQQHPPQHDVNALKRTLINAVSASLLRSPDFAAAADATRLSLIEMANAVVKFDAEFILKVALYTRNELNIRTTANFLLAFAAYSHPCRQHIKKYYSASVRLPSDWIEIAELYTVFGDTTLSSGSIPAALRRAMTAKFPDFDKYQLGKYNKENATKKKLKKKRQEKIVDSDQNSVRGRGGRGRGVRGYGSRGRGGRVPRQAASTEEEDSEGTDTSSSDEENEKMMEQIVGDTLESDTEEAVTRRAFTLKMLIRKLHVTEPVEHVMCLIGKRYPSDFEEFYQSRLPGTFEEERAGKRMKLPTPETWETQVSLKGNKAKTWEDLIDHKKLPFMAMLRNLRNMIKAGISRKHHDWVIKKLTDEGAVVNSRQFPFRFFSAYEVLSQLEKEYEENQSSIIEAAVAAAEGREEVAPPSRDRDGRVVRGRGRGGRGRGRGGRGGRGGRDRAAKPLTEVPYDTRILQQYKRALDTAVKIATTYNVTPICGRSVIFVNLGHNMNVPCGSARGLGKPRTRAEIGALLGLMCKYSCEEAELYVYGNKSARAVELEKGTILDNMASVLAMQNLVNDEYGGQPATMPDARLLEILRDRTQLDNLLVLSDGVHGEEGRCIKDFLHKYRWLVSEHLLFVSVDLSGATCGVDSNAALGGHENDVYIAGFSDAILRFIAERGNDGQLTHVENIDLAFDLKKSPSLAEIPSGGAAKTESPEKPLQMPMMAPRWRSARVFISSTFRDMHGERDLLTRFVFPELRARAKALYVNIYEVDLRWGVTEEQARSNMTLELCLSEVSRCQFFIGILGERYGWQPHSYEAPDVKEYDWLKDAPRGLSVTDLEFQAGALREPFKTRGKAFFFIRNSDVSQQVPENVRDDFIAENHETAKRMLDLKHRVRHSGHEVYDNYPCHWGGIVDQKPVVAGLESFGQRVLNNLWNAIKINYPRDEAFVDELSHEAMQHEAHLDSERATFVGRSKQLKECMNMLKENPTGFVVVTGKPGTGKSALLATVIQKYRESPSCNSSDYVLIHFVGASAGSTSAVGIMRRLCLELDRRFALGATVPHDYAHLVGCFRELVSEAAALCSSPLTLFIDGVDLLDKTDQARTMAWLPRQLPENVLLIVSVRENTDVAAFLTRMMPDVVFTIGDLDILDKATVVRSTLQQHRKQLDESPFNNQMKLLVSKKAATNPLYLSLACEELRVAGVYEQLTTVVRALPQTLPQLLQTVLSRLEADHGRPLVEAATALLVCSRDGLCEDDLHHLLSHHGHPTPVSPGTELTPLPHLSPRHQLPTATFSQLLRGIKGLLRPAPAASPDLLVLTNQEVASAITTRYLKAAGSCDQYHKLLAGYFLFLCDPHGNRTYQGTSTMAFSHLPYHLAECGCFSCLQSLLCDLHFLYAKCSLHLTDQLLEDFLPNPSSLKKNSIAQKKMKKFEEAVIPFKDFVYNNIHILSQFPCLIWQQAANMPDDSPLQLAAKVSNKAVFGQELKSILWINKQEGVTTDCCKRTLSNLSTVITCVCISADGMYFACGAKDCMVRLYRLDTGKDVRTFVGHSAAITDVCFLGAERIVTASEDTTTCIWDTSSGHRLFILRGHTRRVSAVAVDPAGSHTTNHLVTAGWDCSLKVWDARSGKLAYDLKGETRPINCVSYHPEGQQIVTASWDSAIRIWDVFHKKRKAVLRGHSTSVRQVRFSTSGRHVASASLCGEIKLWSATNGAQVGTMVGHALPINSLTFSPKGHKLTTVSDDHKIKVWLGDLGRPVSVAVTSDDTGAVMSVAFHPDGDQVAAGYHEGQVHVYDVQSGILEYSLPVGHVACVRAVAYNAWGSQLLTGSDDTTAVVMDIGQRKKQAILTGHTRPVMTAVFGKSYIVTGGEDSTVCIYNVSQLGTNGKKTGAHHVILTHTGPVTCCAYNTDETRLATASRDKNVYIWDMSNLSSDNIQPVVELTACHADWINGVAWSNTAADYIVTCSNDFTLKLWDVLRGEEKVTLRGHMSAVSSVAYKYGCIVSSCNDGTVKVWSHKGAEITTLRGHNKRVNAADIHVRVSSQQDNDDDDEAGTDWATQVEEAEWQQQHARSRLQKQHDVIQDVFVASGGDDGKVRISRPLRGNELLTLTGHSQPVLSVAASGTGDLVTSSLDRTLCIWQLPAEDADVSEDNSAKHQHDAPVSAIASSEDERYIATAARDGVVKIYTCDGGGQHRLECVCTAQLHSKSVNAVQFATTTSLVTGSDDASLAFWNIIVKAATDNAEQNTIHLKRVVVKQQAAPITSVQVSGQSVLALGWDSSVTVYQAYKMIHRIKLHSNWVLDSCLLGSSSRSSSSSGAGVVLASCGQGEFVVTKWDSITPTKAKPTQSDSHYVKYHYPDDVAPEKQAPNWVTAVVSITHDNYLKCLVVGDVHGQLSLYTDADTATTTQKVVHRGAISCLAADSSTGTFFSASADGTVKVWRGREMKQIGQYFCNSPVTKLVYCHTAQVLITGDILGRVNIFTV